MTRFKGKDKGDYTVYLHTVNKCISGYPHKKYYVGITNDIERRWRDKGYYYKGQVFYNAIQKYGWDNIKHQILYKGVSKKKAQELEREMIIKYDSKVGHNGYNVSDGGEHIRDKLVGAQNIYCLDNYTFYHSAKIASNCLNIDERTIYYRCKSNFDYFDKNWVKKLRNKRNIITRLVYSTNAYKYIINIDKTKMKHNSTFVVDIATGIVYPRKYIRSFKNGVRLLTLEKYYDFANRGILNHRTRYMDLKDYLYLFNYATLDKKFVATGV